MSSPMVRLQVKEHEFQDFFLVTFTLAIVGHKKRPFAAFLEVVL